jgi:hypothetical protein
MYVTATVEKMTRSTLVPAKAAMLIVIFMLVISEMGNAQQCHSIAAASKGGWKPMDSAPRDGSVVELVQTHGIAPWYGRFKWTRETRGVDQRSNAVHDISPQATWVNVDEPSGVIQDDCLFWRPYKGTGRYIDPTRGAQNSVAYWCAGSHRPYDKKTDTCE